MFQYMLILYLHLRSVVIEQGFVQCRERFRALCRRDARYKNTPMADYGKRGLTEASYRKGMTAFYVLYQLLGEENFLNSYRTFCQEYGESGASLEEFVSHIKQATPIDLNQFFEEWIYGSESSKFLLQDMPAEEIVARYAK